MGSVVYRHHIPLGHVAVLHIQIVDMDANAASMGVGAHICHIFIVTVVHFLVLLLLDSVKNGQKDSVSSHIFLYFTINLPFC